MLDLKARVDGPLDGFVLESRVEKSIGSVASVMVTKGTLKNGDVFVCDDHICRVKAMRNWQGNFFVSYDCRFQKSFLKNIYRFSFFFKYNRLTIFQPFFVYYTYIHNIHIHIYIHTYTYIYIYI